MIRFPRSRWLKTAAVLALLHGVPLSGEERAVTYHRDIEPIFRESCVGCHEPGNREGELDLSTVEAWQKGGESGPMVEPGRPGESLLYLLVAREEKPYMPPRRNGPLPEAEVELIRRWIAGGCELGERPRVVETPRELSNYRRPRAISALTYSPDGGELYLGGYREVIVHARDAIGGGRPGYPRGRLEFDGEQVRSLVFSPDGQWLAAAGGSPGKAGELRVWRRGASRSFRVNRLGRDTLFALSFSSDSARIAAAGAGPEVHVVRLSDGERLLSSPVHADWVLGLAFSAGDERIATVSRDRAAKLVEGATGEFIDRLELSDGALHCLAARPGSDQVLVGGQTRVPVIYDARRGKKVRHLESQTGEILACAFSADGATCALAGADGTIRLYDAAEGKRLGELRIEGGWIYALAFSPAGDELAAAGYDGHVRLIDVESATVKATVQPFPIGPHRKF